MTADESTDRTWMAHAIRLAARGMTTTTPNPRVGCVIVRDGCLLAEGWHERPGGPHAEAMAIQVAAGRSLAGATVYVTLEPCSHHGRTPPCADALIRSGASRVVVAGLDPNPLVAGQGMARLQAAGIATEVGLLGNEAAALNAGYLRRIAGGKPWLRCKLAMSLDGRTAMASGESQWITGPAARREVQRQRARSCAVVTGAGTVRADDPRLDVRDIADTPPDRLRQPLRVVLAGRAGVDPAARIFAPPGEALLACTEMDSAQQDLWRGRGVSVVVLAGDAESRVDPAALLDELAKRDCNEVLLECGPLLSAAFAQAGLIDEHLIYMAPVLLGSRARGLIDLPFDRMAQKLALDIDGITAVGDDWLITARPRREMTP